MSLSLSLVGLNYQQIYLPLLFVSLILGVFFLFVCLFVFPSACGTRDEPRALVRAGQVLCHWTMPLALF